MVRGICVHDRGHIAGTARYTYDRGYGPIYLAYPYSTPSTWRRIARDIKTRSRTREIGRGNLSGRCDTRRRAAQRRWLPLRRGPTSHASRRRRKGGRFTAFDAVRARRTAMTSTGPRRRRARGPRGCPRHPGARRWRAGIAWRPRVSFTVLGLVGELVGEAWQMPRRRRSGRCLRVDRCENPV